MPIYLKHGSLPSLLSLAGATFGVVGLVLIRVLSAPSDEVVGFSDAGFMRGTSSMQA